MTQHSRKSIDRFSWVVVNDGRINSRHRERSSANREAARVDGYVLSVQRGFDLAVGDKCQNSAGIVVPV